MTISSTVRIAGPFIGTSTATVFPFAFKVFTASNLQVVRVDTSTGLESTLVLTTDYTVSLNADQDSNPGGNVTLLAVLATGFNMVITSDIANLQPTDLTNQGGFYPEVITDALDRATIQIQQMADELTRSIKIPISDGLSLDMELPTAAARANSFLAFDATGEPTVVTAGSSGAPTTITRQQFSGTGSQVAYTLASDPGALGNSCEVFVGGIYQQRDTYTIAGTTLTFTAAPVAGTDNIEVVNFLTTAIGTTDSSLVTYVPAGTSATQRTVQAKLRDVVSVKDFGAVGDGVANDTAAVQAAINTQQGVYFPQGTYLCAGLTMSTAYQHLYADSNVRIQKNANGPLVTISANNVFARGVFFYGQTGHTGDCVVITANNAKLEFCAANTTFGFAVKATGNSMHIVGTCEHYYSADASGHAISIGTITTPTNYHVIDGVQMQGSVGGVLCINTSGSISNSTIGNLTDPTLYVTNTRIAGTVGAIKSFCQINNCTITGNVTFGNGVTVYSGIGFGPNVFVQSGSTITVNSNIRDSSLYLSQLDQANVVDLLSGTANDLNNVFFVGRKTYTSAWTASGTNPVLGNGVITAFYTRTGSTTLATVELLIGSTTTFGTGDWRFSLPTTVFGAYIGSAVATDSGVAQYVGSAVASAAVTYCVITTNSGNATSAIPFTWATGDVLRFSIQYESV